MKIKIKTLDHFDLSLKIPTFMTEGAAGADICASLPDKGKLVINPFERVLIPTGLTVEIPVGYEIQVRPRSGLSFKTGLTIPNSPGTIDSDYRGELKVIMANLSNKIETISHGDRIAQLVISKIYQAKFEMVENLSSTDRSSGGFGHTGL